MNLGFYKNELINRLHDLQHHHAVRLEKQERDRLKTLKEKGWVMLDEPFFSADEADELAEFVVSMTQQLRDHVWTDNAGADTRIFGLEALSDSAKSFLEYPKAKRILDAYLGLQQNRSTTMAGVLNAEKGKLGSGGDWHRDTADYHQVKAFVYLTDVDEEHGPLQYVEGSHKRSTFLHTAKATGKPWYERRFTDDTARRAANALTLPIRSLTAPKGSVILADTSGLHRGKPIEKGIRIALTNYIWHQRPVPDHIEQLIFKV